ncbi:MAG TPA: hypothetical protein P5267_03315 [Patescibacteria group bacterium]|nr:hypothetical protein [Patescibacteria group bacterium]
MKKFLTAQFVVLLCGTVFAWFNFGRELYAWVDNRTCTLGCPGNATNPFLTPCFGGAIFFTIAFVLSIIILKKAKAVSAAK